MLASPHALSFRTEERRSLGVGRADDDVEAGLSSHQGLLCRLDPPVADASLSERRRGADRKRDQKKQGSHRRRSFRLWLSEAFNVMP